MIDPTPTRPHVSVVLPYYGDRAGAAQAAAALLALAVQPGDELLLADNTPEQVVPHDLGVQVVDAGAVQSPYSARNAGASAASNDWLLFTDADCYPVPDLIDRYFASAPRDRAGAVAGPVEGVPDQPGLIPRYIRSRGFLDQELGRRHPFKPLAVTANLLVRRAAFEEIGGFAEGVRSGADSDFCWRLQDAGWELGWNPDASVQHEHRDTLRGLLRQVGRDGAGLRWLEERHAGSAPRPKVVRRVVRSGGGVVVWAAKGRGEQAVFKAVDGLVAVAEAVGYRLGNHYER